MSKRTWTAVLVGTALCGLMAALPMVLAGPVKAPVGAAKAEPVAPGKQKFRIPGGDFRPRVKVLAADAGESQGWGLGDKGINVAGAWAATKGKGVKVAVLDTGVDINHPDLKDQVVGSKDFSGSSVGTMDLKGHGTHCCGIVAMKQGNGQGFVGVAPECKLLMGKILGDDGTGDFDWATQGVLWAIDQGADVISMSIGGYADIPPDQFFPDLRAAIKKAVDKGIIVVVAAGNSNDENVGNPKGHVEYPGRYEEVITVAASDFSQHIAHFSSRGPEVDVAAPGDNIISTIPGGQYAEFSGTSMATPMVAGVAALYVAAKKAKNEKPSQEDFRKLIETTSFTQSPVKPNPNSGWGLIQADKLVAAVGGAPAVTPLEFAEADFAPAAWTKLKEKVPAIKGLSLEFYGENVKATVKK